MRIGIVGAGRMGSGHALNLAAFGEVSRLVIHDARHPEAERLAGRVGGVALRSADDLLAEVDAVVIACPAAERTRVFHRAVSAGLAVFCEKPLAATLAEAREFTRAARAAGNTRVQIGFQRRCDPEYRAVRSRLKAGELGRPLLIRCTAYDHVPPPTGYARSSGGIFADCLIHDIDAVHWLTGLRTVAVQADEDVLTAEGPYPECAIATAVLTLADGTRATLAASRLNPLGYDHRMELLGTRDSLAIGLGERTPLRSPLTFAAGTAGRTVFTGFGDRFAASYEEEMRAFLRMAADEEPSACTPEEALLAQEVADAAARSADAKARVVLDDPSNHPSRDHLITKGPGWHDVH